jgi:hypothetical protein
MSHHCLANPPSVCLQAWSGFSFCLRTAFTHAPHTSVIWCLLATCYVSSTLLGTGTYADKVP